MRIHSPLQNTTVVPPFNASGMHDRIGTAVAKVFRFDNGALLYQSNPPTPIPDFPGLWTINGLQVGGVPAGTTIRLVVEATDMYGVWSHTIMLFVG